MSRFMFLLDAATTETGGSGIVSILLLYGAIFGIFWFFLIRPQRKKQRQVDLMQSAIEVGDKVVTSGGMYGLVVDSVNDVVYVEFGTNKSVRIPIKRSSILGVAEPDITNYDDESSDNE